MTGDDFIQDILNRRQKPTSGYPNLQLNSTINKTTLVEPAAFEPDAATSRSPYYYNAVHNTLYARVVKIDNSGKKYYHWQRIS